MTRVLQRSWLAAVVCLTLLISMITPVMAQTTIPTLTRDAAIELLRTYEIVQGDQSGNLNLDRVISRAELAKIAVVAYGKGELAPALAASVRFTEDSIGHWGAGYIELAARLELIKGRTNKRFDPDASVTHAEALAIVLRMIGKEPAGTWDPVRIMQTAADLGIGPKIGLDALANLPAQRGTVFESLARAIATVPMANGQTAAQTYLDSIPPVLTLSSAPSATTEDSITISGTVQGANSVSVNGASVPVTGNTFSYRASLTAGENTFVIVASDWVGNQDTETLTVTRGGDIATIEVSGPASVNAGQSVALTIVAKDAKGNRMPSGLLTATVANNMGTFDTKTGVFTAFGNVGPATITLVAGAVSETHTINVNGLASEAKALRIRPSTGIPTAGKSTTINVEVMDAEGNPIPFDSNRVVTLTTSTPGVSISSSIGVTSSGAASFTVSSSQEGDAVFTANSQGLTSASGTVTFASGTRIVLVAEPTSATADGSTPVTIRAMLQNESGDPVTNTSNDDIYVSLSEDSDDSFLTSTTVRIRRGTNSSLGYDGVLVPGFSTEKVRVTGTVTTGHKYTVVPTEVSFREVVIGSAAKLELVGGAGYPEPGLGNPVRLTVRVTDREGNFVPNADVAFKVKLITYNGEEVVDGIPTGVDLTLGSTTFRPIEGYSDGVVARTTDGTAQLNLTYVRSGKVSVQLVPVGSTQEAYDDEGESGRANSSTGMTSDVRDVLFSASTPSSLRVEVDLPGSKLTNQSAGVLPANNRATATIKVYLLDSAQGWMPKAAGSVTLTRTGGNGTRLTGSVPDTYTAPVRNGVAEFSLVATSNVSEDTWTADSSLLPPEANETIKIHTYSAAPEKPSIITISGEAGELNRVLASDDHMLIDIESYSSGHGFVKVFKSSSSTPIFTSDVIDLAASPSVEVPKESLAAADRYYVVVNNGYGDSAKSDLWPTDPTQKVISEKPLKLNITRVRYDAGSRKLTASVSGASSQGIIDPSFLSVRNTVTGDVEYLFGATCTPGSSSFTCILPYELNTADFNGSVVLDTEAGWYRRDSAGEAAQRDETLSDNVLSPMAYVTYGTIQFGTVTVSNIEHVTGTLTLYGTNLDQGRIYLSQLTVGGYPMGTGSAVAPTGTSSKVTITIPNYANTSSKSEADSIAAKIKDLAGPTIELNGSTGWLKASSGEQNGSISAIPVYAVTQVSKIQYVADTDGDGQITTDGGKIVIHGSGFTGATVDPNSFVFTDRRGEVIAALALTGYTAGSVTISDDGDLIEITITEADAAVLEGGSYNGNVYLTSVETSPLGSWFTNVDGWYGTTLPRYRLSW